MINISERLSRIKHGVEKLSRMTVFGSSIHKNKLLPPARNSDLLMFENLYKIQIPLEFRGFLESVGNGGLGPGYGVFSLEEIAWSISDVGQNPMASFPISESWNMAWEPAEMAAEEFEERYFDPIWVAGTIRICDYGCGSYAHLVVSGPMLGSVWIDDRVSDGGIYPATISCLSEADLLQALGFCSFLDWYEAWLHDTANNNNNKKDRRKRQDESGGT